MPRFVGPSGERDLVLHPSGASGQLGAVIRKKARLAKRYSFSGEVYARRRPFRLGLTACMAEVPSELRAAV